MIPISEFVALALSIENDGIFSNDGHFDNCGIKRWTVEEIIRWLEKRGRKGGSICQ